MEEFEVIENVGVLLRLRLKDKTPPCVIKFKPTTPNATFKVFYSEILKEPDEFDNHGSEVNPSKIVLAGTRPAHGGGGAG